MKQFDWQEVLHEDLFESILKAAGGEAFAGTPEARAEIRALLVRLLKIAGGLPFTDHSPSAAQWDELARQLIEQALRKAFVDDLPPLEEFGTTLNKMAHGPLVNEIEYGKRVCINGCSEEELAQLPAIGSTRARQIVLERRTNGAFSSGKQLAERVPGLGESTVGKLMGRLRFGQRPTVSPPPQDGTALTAWLVARTGLAPLAGLRSVLDFAVAKLGGSERSRWHVAKICGDDTLATVHDCDWVGLLNGCEYYYWLANAIDDAKATVDMAMFHVALPTANHPTRLLVDKLVAAKQRGVDVRVLLDRDREEDPYRSSVINRNAFDALEKAGVAVRCDAEDRLLHSKFLVIDADITVLGSHNWSAGSYFSYDDLSLAISSKGLAETTRHRFDTLWKSAA